MVSRSKPSEMSATEDDVTLAAFDFTVVLGCNPFFYKRSFGRLTESILPSLSEVEGI